MAITLARTGATHPVARLNELVQKRAFHHRGSAVWQKGGFWEAEVSVELHDGSKCKGYGRALKQKEASRLSAQDLLSQIAKPTMFQATSRCGQSSSSSTSTDKKSTSTKRSSSSSSTDTLPSSDSYLDATKQDLNTDLSLTPGLTCADYAMRTAAENLQILQRLSTPCSLLDREVILLSVTIQPPAEGQGDLLGVCVAWVSSNTIWGPQNEVNHRTFLVRDSRATQQTLAGDSGEVDLEDLPALVESAMNVDLSVADICLASHRVFDMLRALRAKYGRFEAAHTIDFEMIHQAICKSSRGIGMGDLLGKWGVSSDGNVSEAESGVRLVCKMVRKFSLQHLEENGTEED